MISYDVFDTLITRKTIFPNGIFLVVQEQLDMHKELQEYKFLCKNFKILRMDAERQARIKALKYGVKEVTLEQIYQELQLRTSIPTQIKEQILQMEINAEIDNSYPIRQNIELLKQHYQAGKKIILISDMYLEEPIIRKILIQWDSIFEKIPIYVSADWKCTKGNGLLFLEVAKAEHQSFGDWVHYGDNKICDYFMPKMLGIDARWLQNEEMTTWEKELGSKLDIQNNLPLQYFIGAARIIRIENKLNLAGKVGASIGGMLLYPYVLWLIKRSIEYNIKRLYFVARDGYVLKIIADEIISYNELDIETKYVYGSRIAWRTDDLSIQEKELLLGYLEQEGNFSDENYAFVDLSASGYTMSCITDILFEKYKIRTKAFFYALEAATNRVSKSFFFFSFCTEYSTYIEYFCRAPHNVTLGYKIKDSKIIPKIMDENEVIWEKSGLLDYINGTKLITKKISSWYLADVLETPMLAQGIMDYCIQNPCKEIADFLGNIPHSGSWYDEKWFSPKLTLKDIYMIYMYCTIEPFSEIYHGCNITFSLVRTEDKIVKWKNFFESHYDGFLGKMVQLYKNRKYLIPYGSRKKIIIYGAGNIGKKFHRHLLFNNRYKIVAWTDMNYEKYKKQKVVSLSKALEKKFDYIVVAIANRHSYDDMCQIFEKLGIDRSKIQYYKEAL